MSHFAKSLRISDFDGYTKVRSDTVIFSKLHGELPVLIHRTSENPKAHMQGIDFETLAEAFGHSASRSS